MTSWLMWAGLLLIQNASFTMVSRARNSASVVYHAIAAVFSNGVYFCVLYFSVNKIADAQKSHSALLFAATAAFYTLFTVIGGVSAHSLLMRFVERGKRKIGS